jgi:hypothetical protein
MEFKRKGISLEKGVEMKTGMFVQGRDEQTQRNCWVWEPKGQISEYPIPHGEHYEPCTLRRTYKSAFMRYMVS